MKQNSISDLPVLQSSRLENLFNVYLDPNTDTYFYNILNTISFDTDNMSPSIYELYTIEAGDTYTYISFKKYNTINLWWLVCAFNNIQNPTRMPESGEVLRILRKEHVPSILTEINKS